jgi:hypothetical protein
MLSRGLGALTTAVWLPRCFGKFASIESTICGFVDLWICGFGNNRDEPAPSICNESLAYTFPLDPTVNNQGSTKPTEIPTAGFVTRISV